MVLITPPHCSSTRSYLPLLTEASKINRRFSSTTCDKPWLNNQHWAGLAVALDDQRILSPVYLRLSSTASPKIALVLVKPAKPTWSGLALRGSFLRSQRVVKPGDIGKTKSDTFIAKAFAGEHGVAEKIGSTGIPEIVAYHPVEAFGTTWALIGTESREAAQAAQAACRKNAIFIDGNDCQRCRGLLANLAGSGALGLVDAAQY